MSEFVRFTLLGLGVGALYSLAAQGLVLIYRGSGVLNFAHGAIGIAGAYLWWELVDRHGWATGPAAIAGVLASALIGALTHVLIMRPLRRASPLSRVVSTLGVLISLQAIVVLRYGTVAEYPDGLLPTESVHLVGTVISIDRLLLVGIAIALTMGLWSLYHHTRFGLGTQAVAENQRAAAAVGWSPDVIATANWALGSGIAGAAGILIAPITTLQTTGMTGLVLAGVAAALVAAFRSFPVALLAGLAIGVAETVLTRYIKQPGLGASIPFIVIVVVVVARGQALPLRDFFLQRLPRVGDGRVRLPALLLAVAAGALLLGLTPTVWVDSFTVTLATGLILLAIVVLTGYAGQLSLAEYVIGGFGAWVAGRLVVGAHVPFWLAVVAGVLAAVPFGLLFALPAVRSRGINLAVVTLGLGSATELMLFNNDSYTGGYAGTQLRGLTLFGLDIDAINHPVRYGLLTLACFVLVSLMVANMRRGVSGRRLIAVRSNERASAALGINVTTAKLYAFGLAAAIASLGGILLAFRLSVITYSDFSTVTSISEVGYAMIGGIGYLVGPVLGATLAPGAFGTTVSDHLLSGLSAYVPLIGGVLLILLVLLNQDGLAREHGRQLNWLIRKLVVRVPARLRARTAQPDAGPCVIERRGRAAQKTLEVHDITVRFGAVTAVDTVSLTVRPGRVLGVIGPNGAGKTTLIDALTGFVPPAAGSVRLDGEAMTEWSPARRARAGVSRSFQSLELFEDSTVLDNLRTACDPSNAGAFLSDLVRPSTPELPGEVVATIREFGLEDHLGTEVQDLSYGQRRLLAVARAVATQPSVLLLDEPVAGLGDAESHELGTLIRRLAEDWRMGILLIEHDMTFVMSVCDELVVLDFGRKISQGPPEVVRTDKAVIDAYLGSTGYDDGRWATAPAGGDLLR